MKLRQAIFAVAAVAGALIIAAPGFADSPLTSNPRGKLAVQLLDTVFNQRKVQEGFDRYVGATYKQHNPYAADGRQAAIDFLSKWLGGGGEYKYDFKHVYVDRNIVIVHSLVTRGAKDPSTAVVDIFRFDHHNKIVEHWDVVQQIPDKPANDNTMF